MKKDIIAILVIIFCVVLLCTGVKIQSVDQYYLTHLDDITPDSETVFIEIRCDTILDNWDMLDEPLKNEKYVPATGVILEKKEYVLRKNDTVLDILDRAVRYNKIHMETTYNSTFGSAYIQGINHLYEFSCGPRSGWMYKVNGIFPSYGVSRYKLKDKDDIKLLYTCDYGADLEGGWVIE